MASLQKWQLIATVSVLVLVLFIPCTAAQEWTPTLYVLFIDMSVSGRGQEAHWQSAAEQMVFSRFRAGDALVVYGLHDHTGESAALFQGETPVVDLKAGRDATVEARRRYAATLSSGREVVRQALAANSVRAKETRVVESLRRVPKANGRRVKLIYFSDMLESTKTLDLERLRLTGQNTGALVEAAVMTFHVEKGSLVGVSVYCVLDSPNIGQASGSPSPRSALERFWKAVLDAAGARLEWFDSTVFANGR